MFGNKEYEFTQEFTSATLGNVYVGKKLHLPQRQGEKFIAAGLAKEVVAKKPEVKKVDEKKPEISRTQASKK